MKVVFRSEGMPLDPLLEAARLAEQAGGHALLTAENRFDPFLPLVLAAEHTSRIKIGPSVAIAFPRSPFMTAQLGWELQRYSNGRFELGLGTQVRGHIRRRFGASWEPPVRRMREYIGAVRSIWHSFQTGERLNVTGEFYSLNLLTPQFNPGPIDHPDIPVLVAGANRGMCRLAGSACEGLLLHPLASPEYVRQVAWPAVEEGAQSADRSLDAFELSSSGFVAAGDTDAEVGGAMGGDQGAHRVLRLHARLSDDPQGARVGGSHPGPSRQVARGEMEGDGGPDQRRGRRRVHRQRAL